MITRIGLVSLFAGAFIGLFSGISTFMNSDNMWVGLTFAKILGEERAESIITGFDSIKIQNILDYMMYEVSMFVFLLFSGIVLLVIGMFVKDH